MKFENWIDTFVSEKGLNTEEVIEVEGTWGTNFIPFHILIDAIKSTSEREKMIIRNTIVKIDFRNGDVMHFFKHLAQALAI